MWVRPVSNPFNIYPYRFQFTHPCGCDTTCCVCTRFRYGFNSRTRVGATVRYDGKRRLQAVSIHAPVWVRQPMALCLFPQRMFQFTHPCGCDEADIKIRAYIDSFNSRTRVGATFPPREGAVRHEVSIHAPVWVRRPDEYGLSIKHATKVLRQPDARTRCGQA